MDNIEIREFQQAIVNFINKSDLPVEVKRLSLCEVMGQLSAAADGEIRAKLEERNKQKEEGEKDGIQQSVHTD